MEMNQLAVFSHFPFVVLRNDLTLYRVPMKLCSQALADTVTALSVSPRVFTRVQRSKLFILTYSQ